MSIARILSVLICLCAQTVFAQGTFQSHASGNWDAPTSWTLVSGTSTTGFPSAGDTANIASAHIISVDVNSQCDQLNISAASTLLLNTAAVTLTVSNSVAVSGASFIAVDQGIMTVTGSFNESAASTITLSQGAITVIGFMTINAPTTTTGNTLLDVEGGAFSCAGGMSLITTIPATRSAELRIGNSAVNVAGGLATISANSKINFTGTGSLSLAGIVSIANANSFSAGNGRVIYVGIPGSDQVVAPLTYNRLLITGLGSGLKKISGTVTVTDTLTLFTDTLTVVTGGSLIMSNNATIVRTAGRLLNAPNFLGNIDEVYNDIVKDTTGAEMPVSTSVLRNLYINDISGIKLEASITVNNTLSLLQGALLTDTYLLNISNSQGGPTADPAIIRTNGYVSGTIKRTIGATTGIRSFPFGISTLQGYREYQLNFTTAPTAAGSITAQHFNNAPTAQSGLPLQDGTESIINVAPMYWQADAADGLAGGIYTVTLTAEGAPGISNISTLRIIKRTSAGGAWVVNGTPGINSGTITAPVIVRTGMAGFSQFTFGSDMGNVLPVRLLYFNGKQISKNNSLSWATSSEANSGYFDIERSVNGASFICIGKVNAAGNSTVQRNYSFTDMSLFAPVYYYRLSQTDLDGNQTFSNVIYIKTSNNISLKVYPSLATTQLYIESADVVLCLYNSTGQFIQYMNIGNNDVSKLARGNYFIKDENKEVVEFIRQ